MPILDHGPHKIDHNNCIYHFQKPLNIKYIYVITTTITLSTPEETIAEYIGFPAVPDGSPSSLHWYWSPTCDSRIKYIQIKVINHRFNQWALKYKLRMNIVTITRYLVSPTIMGSSWISYLGKKNMLNSVVSFVERLKTQNLSWYIFGDCFSGFQKI